MAPKARYGVPVHPSGSHDAGGSTLPEPGAGPTAAPHPGVADFRAIFDASNDAILIHDIETGAIVDANRVACEVHGVTVEELRARGISIIGDGPPPFTPDLATAHIARAAAGEAQRFEWCSYHPQTGAEMWVEVSLQRVAMAGTDRLLAIVRDVRERKHAEHALRQANEDLERRVAERTVELEAANRALEAEIAERAEAERAIKDREEHFRRLIENGSDFIMIVDATAAITYVGPSVRRILGYEPHEMMGTRPVDMVHPDDVPHVMEALADIVGHPGTSVMTTFRVRHRDGSWRVFENIGKTLSPHSADDGIVANGRDVTERHRTEAALAKAKEAAERANRAKSEFLSRMSHELRTPMNSILGFAQVLEGFDLPDRQRKCVDHILRAGRHLLQLINEVLEISRIEAGRHHLSLEPVRIDTVLQDAIGLARPLAAQARIELGYAAPNPEDVYVRADRQRLSQVLLNLLSNAIKYNRAGGRVRVHCEIVPGDCGNTSGDGEIVSRNGNIGSRDDDGAATVVVRVEDTGRGIAPDDRDELFTPFARLGAENSDVEGTGLGLALSHRLTEAMGGSLTLERSSAEGSVFRLELRTTPSPLDRVEDAPASPRASGEAPHRPAVLLYVEDNLANLSLVETILWRRPRWRTIPALQGQIGVELAREHVPDVILLDLHLPDIRGEEVLRRLREDERTTAVPVVIISADATRSATERLIEAGAAAFLTKPLDVAEFLATLDRLLPA